MPYAVFAKLGKEAKRYKRWDRKVYETKAAAERAMERLRKKYKNDRGPFKPYFKVAYVKGAGSRSRRGTQIRWF